MKLTYRLVGFSLIEVVMAIGLVAGGVAVVLAMLSGIARQSSDSKELQVALGLSDAVRVQLELERASLDFSSLVAAIPVMAADQTVGRQYVVERNGTNLRLLTGSESPARDQYFLIVVRRFNSGALVYDTTAPYVALNVVVTWPYRVLAPGELLPATSSDARQSINFNLVLNQ